MFKAVLDSAAAADGGSLCLLVERLDGTKESFVIDRSIASRGTEKFNRVTSDKRELALEDRWATADGLEQLLPETSDDHPVGVFIKSLRGEL